jgi:hypothetical protein
VPERALDASGDLMVNANFPVDLPQRNSAFGNGRDSDESGSRINFGHAAATNPPGGG